MENNSLQLDDDYALVFGMDWFVLDPLDSRHAKILQLREQGARFGASFKQNDEENIGTVAGIGHFGKKIKVLSGAGQIASLPAFAGRTILVLMEDHGRDGNDGIVAVVGLIKGNVIIDKILAPSEVIAIRQSFQDRCNSSNEDYLTAGHTLTIAPVDIPVEWEKLLPQQESRFKKSPFVEVKKLTSGRETHVALALIVLMVVGGAGTFGYQKYAAYKKRQRELVAARNVNPEVLYAASSQEFLNEPKVLLRDAISSVREAIAPIDSEFQGWRLKSIECGTTACQMHWDRLEGTFAEFKARAPATWINIVFKDDGKTIENAFALPMPKHKLPDRSKWVTKEIFQETVQSKWQRYADIGMLSDISPMRLEAVPPGVSPNVLQTSANAIWAVPWDIKDGSSWFIAPALETAPDYMTFSGLKLSISPSGTTFSAKGNIYVKK